MDQVEGPPNRAAASLRYDYQQWRFEHACAAKAKAEEVSLGSQKTERVDHRITEIGQLMKKVSG